MSLISCMAAFRQKNPEVTYSVINNPDSEGSFDLCIADENQEYRFDSKCLLLKVLRIEDLRGVPFIIQSRNHNRFQQLEAMVQNAGFSLNLIIECNDLRCIHLYLASNMGITLRPDIAWKDFCLDESVSVLLNIPFSRNVYLYWNRSVVLSNPTVAAFKGLVEDHYQKLAAPFDQG